MTLERDLEHGLYRENGTTYVGVTSTVSYLNATFFGEDEWAGVYPPLLKMHGDEGTACHRVALEKLAFDAQLIPSLPPWPERPADHPSASRWEAVLLNASLGVQEWADRRKVVALAIEQSSKCEVYGLAGTPDLKAEILWRSGRKRTIVEFKFTSALTIAHRLQVRAYRHLEGYEDCSVGIIVRIDRETGTVQELPVLFGEERHHDAALLNAAQLRRWGLQYGKHVPDGSSFTGGL